MPALTVDEIRKIAVAKADGLTDEMGGNVATPSRGVRQRPIRKRGYHRALRRGEWWAKAQHTSKQLLNSLVEMYKPIIEEQMNETAGLRWLTAGDDTKEI